VRLRTRARARLVLASSRRAHGPARAQILDGRLYIASAAQASNWDLLSDLNVTHIVNCSRTCNFDGTGTNPFSSMINYCSCGFADNASVSPRKRCAACPARRCRCAWRARMRARARVPSASPWAVGRLRFLLPCAPQQRPGARWRVPARCARQRGASGGRHSVPRTCCCGLIGDAAPPCPGTPPLRPRQSDLTDALEQTWNFIDTALSSHPRWVVLVHCASGISRSVALVCHYLMRKEYLSFQDSIQFIRSRHPAAEPNSSFVEQLKLVDVRLRKQRALQQPVTRAPCSPRLPSARVPPRSTHADTLPHGCRCLRAPFRVCV